MNLAVTPIGSCRIHNALKVVGARYPVAVELNRQYGLIYNSKEAVQQIGHMRGRLTLPQHMAVYLCRSTADRILVEPEPTAADLYLVEISSRKILRYKKFFLQSNHVYDQLVAHSGLEIFKILWYAAAEPMAELRRLCLEDPAFHALPDQEQQLVREIDVWLQADDELIGDMTSIVDELTPSKVIFVTHCGAIGYDGVPIAARQDFIDAVTRAANLLGIRVFDPTPLLDEFGQEKGMMKNGTDTEHYTPEFESLLADYMYQHLLTAG